jgi:hypothetical protein
MLTLLLPLVLLASPPSRGGPADGSGGLIVLPRAKAVVHRPDKGMQTVTYRLKMPYVSETAVASIRAAVEKKGWRPLQEDFLNPGLPSSHVRGWGTVIDGTVMPNQRLHAWHGQWSNSSGDVLLYHLEYHCPLDDRVHSDTLDVVGAFIPKTVYERIKAELEAAQASPK